jgi:hypothetical protein
MARSSRCLLDRLGNSYPFDTPAGIRRGDAARRRPRWNTADLRQGQEHSMIRRYRSALLVPLVFALVGVAPAVAAVRGGAAANGSAAICGTRVSAPAYKHIIVIMEENHSYRAIDRSSSAPFLQGVIARCGLATNYHNVTHPSLANYLALAYGGSVSSLSPYLGDCSPTSCSGLVHSNNIFNQLAKRGWMSFDESMPSSCDRYPSGQYAPKHNPALYFSDLNKSCSKRDVTLGSPVKSALLTALSSERLAPALSLVTPNLCSDMHSCSVGTGDAWLRKWLPLITSSTVYKNHDTAVFIVWDEGEPGNTAEKCSTNITDQSCHVAAIVVAPSVKPGTKVNTSLSHYSLLKTIEDLLKLHELGGAKSAVSMATGFNL